MGVRISLYAIDLPQFRIFLDRSLASTLWFYAENGSPDWPLPFTDLEPSFARYVSSPMIGVRMHKEGQHWVDLTRPETFADPFLSTKLQDYLNNSDSFALKFVLRALALCASVNWVQPISEAYRRWWIGSFLDYVEQDTGLSPDGYARLAAIFQKILRIYNCGKALPELEYKLSDFDFPVIPIEDDDLWMGVWTETEVRFVLDFLHSLLKRNAPHFTAPPETIVVADSKRGALRFDDELLLEMIAQEHNPYSGAAGLASGLIDQEWNEWVQQMIEELLRVDDFGFEEPNLVSFIDT